MTPAVAYGSAAKSRSGAGSGTMWLAAPST
jgi:hypothetical protein